MTVPSSLEVMVPSPSLSKREKASLNSGIVSFAVVARSVHRSRKHHHALFRRIRLHGCGLVSPHICNFPPPLPAAFPTPHGHIALPHHTLYLGQLSCAIAQGFALCPFAQSHRSLHPGIVATSGSRAKVHGPPDTGSCEEVGPAHSQLSAG